MTTRFYTGIAEAPRKPLSERPPPAYEVHRKGRYRPDPGLAAAANVAILLGQPLLLTGEPGTGKTRFAYAMASELGLGEVLECFVKSSTSAKDLFYSFDELARFRDIHANEHLPLQRYLSFHGLGKAILFAGGPDRALKVLPGRAFESAPSRGLSKEPVLARRDAAAGRPQTFGDLYPATAFPPNGPRASVVLVDELDKAPRDTPNDMLNEIERLGFDIPELGVRVEVPGDATVRPIVVITSNSEKSLPDPFLRRCVYFDIPFPVDDLREIVYAQVCWLTEGMLLDEALEVFALLRDRSRIQRPPGTAELLAWLDVLGYDAMKPADSLRDRFRGTTDKDLEIVQATLATLAKRPEDRATASDILRSWSTDTR
ncbi:MAG: MoxR family ATPase [Burkholderiaceae bacterium]